MAQKEKDQAIPQEQDSLLSDLIRDEEAMFPEGAQDLETQAQTTEEETEEAQALETQGQTEEEPQSEVTGEEDAIPGISEEFAREYGLPKEMIGKPYSELGRSYKYLQTELTKRSQTKSEEDLEKKGTSTERREPSVAEYIQASIKKLPDPVLDFEAYQRGLGDIMNNVFLKAQSEAEKKVMEKLAPQIQPAREMAQKQMEKEILEEIQSGLEEEADVADVIRAFKENQKDYMPMMLPVYSRNPQKLVQDVLMFYKGQYEAPQPKKKGAVKASDMDVNTRAIKKTQQALEASNKKRPSDLNSQTREPMGKPKRLLDELIEDEEKYFNSY